MSHDGNPLSLDAPRKSKRLMKISLSTRNLRAAAQQAQGAKPAGQAADKGWRNTAENKPPTRSGRPAWRGRPIGDDVETAFATLDRCATAPATIRSLQFRAVPA